MRTSQKKTLTPAKATISISRRNYYIQREDGTIMRGTIKSKYILFAAVALLILVAALISLISIHHRAAPLKIRPDWENNQISNPQLIAVYNDKLYVTEEREKEVEEVIAGKRYKKTVRYRYLCRENLDGSDKIDLLELYAGYGTTKAIFLNGKMLLTYSESTKKIHSAIVR